MEYSAVWFYTSGSSADFPISTILFLRLHFGANGGETRGQVLVVRRAKLLPESTCTTEDRKRWAERHPFKLKAPFYESLTGCPSPRHQRHAFFKMTHVDLALRLTDRGRYTPPPPHAKVPVRSGLFPSPGGVRYQLMSEVRPRVMK